MKKLPIIVMLASSVSGLYAQQAPQMTEVQKQQLKDALAKGVQEAQKEAPKGGGSVMSPKEKEMFGGIIRTALQTAELPSVKAARVQLENSIKKLVNVYMENWSAKLNDVQKNIVYPVMLQVKELLALQVKYSTQYPDPKTVPKEVQAELAGKTMGVLFGAMPIMMGASDELKKTRIDENQMLNAWKVLQKSIEPVVELFKPAAPLAVSRDLPEVISNKGGQVRPVKLPTPKPVTK